MDFRLYARVIWRFRVVCAAGFALALILALFSIAKISPHGLTYRQSELWSSTTRLGVTQHGFPWGRLFAVEPSASGVLTPTDASGKHGIPIADPNRFKDLAILYSELATTDPVLRLILRTGQIDGQIIANPVIVQDTQVLPMIDVTAVSTTPAKAVSLSTRASNALERYITLQQAQNSVPTTDRAVLEPLHVSRKATVYRARSKTMAIVIFLAVMLVTIALAFVLENLRPRLRDIGDEAVGVSFEGKVRRTA